MIDREQVKIEGVDVQEYIDASRALVKRFHRLYTQIYNKIAATGLMTSYSWDYPIDEDDIHGFDLDELPILFSVSGRDRDGDYVCNELPLAVMSGEQTVDEYVEAKLLPLRLQKEQRDANLYAQKLAQFEKLKKELGL